MQLEVGLTFDGPPTISGDGGDLPSGPFTPTDTAPETLEEVCGLRTKSDVVRAWRCGVAPALPGDGVLEVYDGAVLKRGILSPLSKFITNRLLGGFNQRWRGKVFESGKGCNRFGGARANRFGITNSDAKEIERQIRLKVLEKKAEMDPLLKAQLEQQKVAEGSTVSESSSAGAGDGASTDVAERGCRPFTYRIDDSRLDGRPCLVLEYATTGCTGGDALWGPVLGMRDEIREVVPGVLVGLGSFRATGGVRNCAPFVLVRAGASGTE